jgi:hypothetical protein
MGTIAASFCRKNITLTLLLTFAFKLLFAQAPVITSFSPASGSQRGVIVITGTNFKDVLAVRIGGSFAASYKVVNSTTIEAIVGVGSSGQIWIATLQGNATADGFTYIPLPAPTISSFSPMAASAGAVVIINGTNFNPVASKNLVRFGTVKATVTAATPNSLSVIVPPGADYQPVSVTNNDFTAYSKLPFTLTFSGGGFMLPTSFDKAINLSGVQNNETVFIADIDEDGKADLVTASWSENVVSVYKNTSTGNVVSFSARVTFPAAVAPKIAAIRDLNGDGKLDIITVNDAGGSSSISTFQNTGAAGTLSFSRKDYGTGNTTYSYPDKADVMDLDGDGRPEIVVIHNDYTLSVFRNESNFLNIVLASKMNYAIGQFASGIKIRDLDGDGKPDLAISNSSENSIIIIKNTSIPGSILLETVRKIPTATYPDDIEAADFDGDGKLDLTVVNNSTNGSVSVFKNISTSGNFSFESLIDYKVGYDPKSIAVSDLDGDGRPDIAFQVRNGADNTISVLRNIGNNNISFDKAVQCAPGDRFVALGDIDGDGIPDIVSTAGISISRNRLRAAHITSFTPVYGGTGTVITIKGYNLKNVTAVTFGGKPAASYTIVSDTILQATVGAGATGNIELVSSFGNASASGFTFSGAPLIHSFEPLNGAVGSTVIITGANFNTVGAYNTVYFGGVKAPVTAATANKLTVIVPPGASSKPVTVTTNGLSGYSNLSFAVTFPGAPATILPQSFNAQHDVLASAPSSVAVADIDMDGKPDLLASDNTANKVSVFRNTGKNGSISFAPKVDLNSGENTDPIKTGDFNGDGALDILTGGSSVRIQLNGSTPGNIAFPSTINVHGESYMIAPGDIDADGKPDVCVMNGNSLIVYRNISANGSVSFAGKNYVTVDGSARAIALCDFNNDMKSDVVVGDDTEGAVYVFQNTSTPGNISFGVKRKYFTGVSWYEGIATNDINNDGKTDIIIVNRRGANASVIVNRSDTAIAFNEAVSLSTGSNPEDLDIGDIDGDGRLDIVTLHNDLATHNFLSIIKNLTTTTPQFAPYLSLKTALSPRDVNVSDLDGDGKPDLVVSTNYTNSAIAIYRNKINEPVTVPSGTSPVNGNIQTKTIIDPTVQTYNNQPYVQRHYEIVPENNESTATATITLFFSQQEFDNFNAYPGHGSDLPKNSIDAPGIANLRIYQYHGYSATAIPGSYDGGGIEIDPTDNNVIWNPAAQWWEVTFTVNGFSGFFVSSAGFKYQQSLALTANTKGITSFCEGGNVSLTASSAANYQWYKDGVVIKNANSQSYQATQSGIYTVTTSVNNVHSIPSNGIEVKVTAMPAKPVISLNGNTLFSSEPAGNQWYKEGILLQGEVNQSYKPSATGNYSVIASINGCTGVASNSYQFVLTGVINIDNEQFIKLSPNPVTSSATLTFSLTGTQTVDVQVMDMRGVVYRTCNKLTNGDQVHLNSLASGIYMAKIYDPNKKKQYVIKLMKL